MTTVDDESYVERLNSILNHDLTIASSTSAAILQQQKVITTTLQPHDILSFVVDNHNDDVQEPNIQLHLVTHALHFEFKDIYPFTSTESHIIPYGGDEAPIIRFF